MLVGLKSDGAIGRSASFSRAVATDDGSRRVLVEASFDSVDMVNVRLLSVVMCIFEDSGQSLAIEVGW